MTITNCKERIMLTAKEVNDLLNAYDILYDIKDLSKSAARQWANDALEAIRYLITSGNSKVNVDYEIGTKKENSTIFEKIEF